MSVGTVTAAAITGGASLAGTIWGAHKQEQASDKALEYAKSRDAYTYSTEANRYGQLAAGLQPFVSTGGAADAKMASLLGLPAPAPSSAPPPQYGTQPIPGMPAPGSTPSLANQGIVSGGTAMPSQPGAAGPADGVLMQAPGGGGQRKVPSNMVQDMLKKGATIVGVPSTGSPMIMPRAGG